MTRTRAAKVAKVADELPTPEIMGAADADLLVIGWGGTKGHLEAAVKDLQQEGKSIAHLHFNYLNPLPQGVEELLKGHKHLLVCELNEGQFASYLRQNFQHYTFEQYNKTEGQPFTLVELKEKFYSLL
jgi:2-oxoglutarate ferredoxin oxidoreductase subunit alpha